MSNAKGFTLIELLLVIVIMVILLSIAIPTYQHHITKVKRLDAQTTLLAMAAKMQQYTAENHGYIDADGHPPSLAMLGVIKPHTDYQFSVQATAETYTLSAQALGAQASNDKGCITLSVTQSDVKAPASCW